MQAFRVGHQLRNNDAAIRPAREIDGVLGAGVEAATVKERRENRLTGHT